LLTPWILTRVFWTTNLPKNNKCLTWLIRFKCSRLHAIRLIDHWNKGSSSLSLICRFLNRRKKIGWEAICLIKRQSNLQVRTLMRIMLNKLLKPMSRRYKMKEKQHYILNKMSWPVLLRLRRTVERSTGYILAQVKKIE